MTTLDKESRRRTYADPCGIARALDRVGERWALLVVRELTLGPKRFTDLRAGLPQIGPDILSARLRELEGAGVVRRRTLAPPAAARVYELTDWGQELEDVLLALGRWGSRAPLPPGENGLSVDALVIALRTLFDPAAAEGLEASYELRLDEQRFRVAVTDGRLQVDRGTVTEPDATITADPRSLPALLWHGRSLRQARRDGDVEIAGDTRAVARLLRLFPAPAPHADAA